MKVIYQHKLGDETIPRLTLGKEYLVVGVDDQHYRVLNDAREPILYPRDCFLVTESEIPSVWVRRDYPDGEFHIDPEECSQPGFYEDYFDGLEKARATFEEVIQRLRKG